MHPRLSVADIYKHSIGAGQAPLPYKAIIQQPRICTVKTVVIVVRSARITDAEGKLLFINDTMIPSSQMTNPTTDVEIVVPGKLTDEGAYAYLR